MYLHTPYCTISKQSRRFSWFAPSLSANTIYDCYNHSVTTTETDRSLFFPAPEHYKIGQYKKK